MLTSYSLGIALRVVNQVGQMAKGTDPHADQAFEIVSKILARLIGK